MLQMKLEDVFRRGKIAEEYKIYLVKDKECILHIGESANPIKRLRQHRVTGKSFSISSFLGALINANEPESHRWDAEFYTVEEIIPEIDEERQKYREEQAELYASLGINLSYTTTVPTKPYTAKEAEYVMIQKYSPCLNIDHNFNRAPLPEKYNTEIAVKKRYLFPLPANTKQYFGNRFKVREIS